MPRECGDPCCRCHINAGASSDSWRRGYMRDLDHGTNSCYQSGCRCKECRAASAAYTRKRRAARAFAPSPSGTP